MDYTALTQLIGSLGFPIVMCILLFSYMREQNEQHKEETNALKDAVNELRVAITTLTDKLEK